MEKLDGKSRDIVADNIQKLKELFPETFTEDGSYGTAKNAKAAKKIDFDVLKEVEFAVTNAFEDFSGKYV